MSGGNYRSGYVDGQLDTLAFLAGRVESDDPFAPIATSLTIDYALWCLSFCLVTAAACKCAEVRGKAMMATSWNSSIERRYNQVPVPVAKVTDYNHDWFGSHHRWKL